MHPDDPIRPEPDGLSYEIKAVVTAPRITLRTMLDYRAVTVPPTDELVDYSLNAKLWEIIHTLAACRIFLHSTDHLSDRELYNLLADRVLTEETMDANSGFTNRYIDLLEFAPEGRLFLYLKYYAEEQERRLLGQTLPSGEMPVRELPPFARDRFLPQPCPPNPRARKMSPEFDHSNEGDVPFLRTVKSETPPPVVPAVNLPRVKLDIAAAEDHSFTLPEAAHHDPKVEQSYFNHVKRVAVSGWVKPIDELVSWGLSIPDPDSQTDAEVSENLAELVQELAAHDFYLYHTDHLSDRELYSALWQHVLREEIVPGGVWHHDFIGNGSTEAIQVWLRYYATPDERENWAEEWPQDPIPDHQPLPYDRDKHLPKG
jgi:hypothetical protein